MAIDPWTAHTAKYHPEIHARLEKFLDECARAAGHERKHEAPLPQMIHGKKPTDSPKFMESIRKVRERQKAETDARNLGIVRELAAGKSIDWAVKKLKLSCVKSLLDSLRASYARGGFGEEADLYLEIRPKLNGRIRDENKKAKEKSEETVMVFDGYNAYEVKKSSIQ